MIIRELYLSALHIDSWEGRGSNSISIKTLEQDLISYVVGKLYWMVSYPSSMGTESPAVKTLWTSPCVLLYLAVNLCLYNLVKVSKCFSGYPK